ncbi:MAG: extracellular solute-binding protein, partial [Caulobacterales bacterium]|nr:extracellular solute-binding protein [Caulobacterales bacterium]
VDRYGLGLDVQLEYLLPFVWQNDGALLDADGALDADNPGMIEALAWVQDLRRRGIVGFSTDVGSAWNMDGFGRERFAMAMSGRWAVNFLADTFPDTPYEIAPLPAGKSRASIAFVVGYSMPADVADPAKAWRLLRHLAGPEGQMDWARSGVALSPRRSIVAAVGQDTDPGTAVFVESAAWARTWQVGADMRLLDEAETAMQAIFLVDTPVEEAIARMRDRLDRR